MKKNFPVSGREVSVPEGVQLISSTDLKGRITHCNQALVNISGFSKDELIGSSHNIVRHPDMPQAAFAELWDTLKAGKPWMGVVKNRAKNGDHYWVNAFVAPVFEDGQTVGYESVRIPASRDQIARAEGLYQRINAQKTLRGLLPFKTANRIALANSALFALLSAALIIAGSLTSLPGLLLWLLGSLGGWLSANLILKPLREIHTRARGIFDSPVATRIYTGNNTDLGQISLGLTTAEAKLRTVLGRIEDSANRLNAQVASGRSLSETMAASVDSQQQEIAMLATAIEEMSTNVVEVAKNAGEVAQNTHAARQGTESGKVALREAISTTQQVAVEVEKIADTIRTLEEHTGAIDKVLMVIREIAEQTNLLALNAAIEAARAGEQGRGFAVVADEVRTLASRSHASTQEIQATIEQLQSTSREAVDAMDHSLSSVENGVNQTEQVGEQLDDIFDMVAKLDSMNMAIASATDQQGAVAQEVSKNVHRIADASRSLKDDSDATHQLSSVIHGLESELTSVIQRFRNCS